MCILVPGVERVANRGTVYSANQPIEVDVVVSWKAPFTSGNRAILPANTLLVVRPDLPEGATAIAAEPLSSKRFESLMITDEAYTSARYAGYHLVIDINTFLKHCHCYYSLPADTRPVWPAFSTTGEAIEGCLLGTAVGDALGLPYEGLSRKRLRKLSNQLHNYRLCFGKGMFSDDTEHTVMVAQALCTAPSPDAFGAFLGRKLKRWFACLPAGIGFATLRACLKLWLGWPATRSGVFSAGNGPMMRSALIGVTKGADPDALKVWVYANTRITHCDPIAYYCALAIALLGYLGLGKERPTPELYYQLYRSLIDPDDSDADYVLGIIARTVVAIACQQSEDDFLAEQALAKGVSGYSIHSLSAVLFCYWRYGDDLQNALKKIIALGGDTDTTAAILGGVLGSFHHKQAIPREWLSNIIDRPLSVRYLESLAKHLTRGDRPPPLNLPLVLVRNAVFMVIVLAHGFRRLLPL